MFGGFINPPLGGSIRGVQGGTAPKRESGWATPAGSIRGVQGGTAPFCRKVKKVKYGYDFFKNSKKS